MSTAALALVLTSACLHATWNLLAKRAGGGAEFTWLFALMTTLIYAPVALGYAAATAQGVTLLQVGFSAGSALIHVGYFLSLQRGYRMGDLSLVYPLARGTGPLLATLAAVVVLGERPSALTLGGTTLIVGSVVLLTGGLGALGRARPAGLGYGLLTGLFIAFYTVWDAYAVGPLGTAPLLFMWMSEAIRTLILTPVALKDRTRTLLEWREHRREAFGIALLSPLAYILVLSALAFSPVSSVAPTREVSILIGTFLGARVLAEGDARKRLLAASAMVFGVALLTLG